MSSYGCSTEQALQRPVEPRQYTSAQFARACDRHGVRRSMGRVGTSYDALAEAFFATMKRELRVNQRTWASETEVRREVFRWIAFYNQRRLHSALGHRSPIGYKRSLRTATVNQPTAA